MSPFSDPSILDSLGILLMAVGGAGLVALFVSQPLRPLMKRLVAVLFPVMAVAGVLLTMRAATLRDSDRDLTPAQLADLAKAVSQFPNIKFEVYTANADSETQALASKVVEAVKAGTGSAPPIGTSPPPSSSAPWPFKGVVLVMKNRDAELGRAVATKIGRVLMAARVAVITDDEASLDDRTVRIIVAEKP